jgi:polyhydroxyalkanoate synthesis repressor PhaR
MPDRPSDADRTIQLHKYPNRRYYDVTRSQHVTLEEIYRLIRDGYDIVVTDSKTGEDITAKVLTQIILEHESPKLDLFPVELLHQVIRANEPIVRDFIEKYFSQAFLAFTQSQEQFNQYLRQALGLPSPFSPATAWSRLMLGPLAHPFFAGETSPPRPESPPEHETSEEDLRAQLEQLRQQVASLQEELKGR